MGDLVIDDLNKLEPLGELTSNVPTPSFAEIVIRTAQLDTMKCWYQAVLGVAPFIDRRNPRPDGSTPSGGANRAADMQGVLFFDVRRKNRPRRSWARSGSGSSGSAMPTTTASTISSSTTET